MNRKTVFILATGLLFLFIGGTATFYPSPLDACREKIERYLHEQEAAALTFTSDTKIFNYLTAKPASKEEQVEETFRRLAEVPFALYLYRGDTLVYWSKLAPHIEKPISWRDKAPSIARLSTGEFLLKSLPTGTDSSIFWLQAIPLRYDYPLESSYLQAGSPRIDDIPSSVRFSPKEGTRALRLRSGAVVGYLQSDGPPFSNRRKIWIGLTFFLGLALLAISWDRFCRRLHPRYPVGAVAFFLLGPLFLHLFAGWMVQTGGLYDTALFEPAINRSSLPSSVGLLLIDSLLALWVMIRFHYFFPAGQKVRQERSGIASVGLALASGVLVLFPLYLLIGLLKVLVLHSEIDFQFDNVFQLQAESVIALQAVLILVIAYFSFTYRMVQFIQSLRLRFTHRLLALISALILSVPFCLGISLSISIVYPVLLGLLFLMLYDLYLESGFRDLTWLGIWLALFAALISTVLFKYRIDKSWEKLYNLSEQLASPGDTEVETRLRQIGKEIQLIPEAQWQEHLDSILMEMLHRSPYILRRYALDFDPPPGAERETLVDSAFRYAVYRLPRNESGYRIELFAPLRPRDEVHLTLDLQQPQTVYDRLLSTSRDLPGEQMGDIDYAIYRRGELIRRKGQPNVHWLSETPIPEIGRSQKRLSSQQADLLYRPDEDTLILLRMKLGGYQKPISLFSYLFFQLLVLTLILSGINRLTRGLPHNLGIPLFGRPSLRKRIQFWVVALILGAFLIIGLSTVTFFRRASERQLSERQEERLQVFAEDLASLWERFAPMENSLALVREIASIHDLNTNLYDPEGRLIAASMPLPFLNELSIPRIPWEAFRQLSQEGERTYVLREKLGSMGYQTAYFALPGEETYFIGAPFGLQDETEQNEVFALIGTLLNIYVFLLILTGVITIVVANSITRPLRRISEKLKSLEIGKNEPIAWSSRDEIGELIDEYNRMITKLEESAEKLMQSEREGAWREMAKQVAHEIKNPLTPMKLSVQHLMRAQKENPDEILPTIERLSRRLIEQIESLSRIASEFSNFAKMPSAKNEKLSLNALLESAFDLYRDSFGDQCTFTLDLPDEDLIAYFDRNHLLRVLNNLLQNALQAIPEDREGLISLSLTRREDKAVISVVDNGQGIPPAMRDRVFSPNFTTKSSGMGLGLAISKNLIQAAGGEIYFRTVENEGSRFFIELPLIQD
ncbi:MAG: ATP-binding protein [Saprospiraceae bacterium]|nr:ATP-binding protein [Saprospiraceae bacterium]